VPVPVDEQGLDVAQGEALAPAARLAYVTPSHQFPLGVTLGLSRRLELLDWAFRAQAWIVEDDFDGEFRYAGKPLASLHSLDRQARVIYLGTFSRVLFPGLRLGYMVVPQDLAKAFRSARALADRGSSLVPQMALTEFFNEGHFQRHLRRMRVVYGERRNVLVEAIRQSLGHLLSVRVPDSGLDLVADLEAGSGDVDLVRQLARGGIELIPLSALYQRTPSRSGLVFGFAGFPERSLRAGIGRMVELLGEPG
jgi:GntR family transcriptional regulator/MocR family aminotransferase